MTESQTGQMVVPSEMKVLSKREKSDACIDSSEREAVGPEAKVLANHIYEYKKVCAG